MSMSRTSTPGVRTSTVDYLIGGMRISLGSDSTTPGPRTHITHFVQALEDQRVPVRLLLASSFPLLSRFARIRQSDYASASASKVWIADIVRVVAGGWSGLNVLFRTAFKPAPSMIYERTAVYQSLTSFHAHKRRAVRVVEVNGILSRETARDRKALKAERLAAFLERRVIRKADIVVAVSEALRDEIVAFAGVQQTKILVVPNAAARELFNAPRAAHDGSVVIGFAGSIVKWQHLDEMLLSFASAVDALDASAAGREVRLEFVGDGAELTNLKSLVASNPLLASRVEFLGMLPHAETLERMASWDIGYAGHEKSSSATMYHSPLKVYEYAALGLAVLCTDSTDARALSESGASVIFHGPNMGIDDALKRAVEAINIAPAEIETRRRAVEQQHTWNARAEKVLTAAKEIERAAVQRVK